MSLVVLVASLFSLCGCGINSQEITSTNERQTSGVEEEDLSLYTSDLLQCVTNEIIKYKGKDNLYRLVTIDVSAFADFPIEGYEKSIQKTYADEDLAIAVFLDDKDIFESENDAEEYLNKNGFENSDNFAYDWDWTSIQITRRTDEDSIQSKELLHVAFSYNTIYESESMNIEVEYDDEEWAVTNVEWGPNS